MINAIGVVVPARDEQDHIVACLSSLRAALSRLPALTGVVTIVVDRCTDGTPERVNALIADWPAAEAIHSATGHNDGIGALRDQGLRHALGRLGDYPTDQIWLLSTDADTTVPPDWVSHHLGLAEAGADAVAGLAELDALDGISRIAPNALRRYRRLLADGMHGPHHDHVYAANLGCRADAYLAAGGFPTQGSGEDHGLWRRLRTAGYRLEQPVTLRVSTSGRLRGRATGGLAGLLRSLHAPRTAGGPDGRS